MDVCSRAGVAFAMLLCIGIIAFIVHHRHHGGHASSQSADSQVMFDKQAKEIDEGGTSGTRARLQKLLDTLEREPDAWDALVAMGDVYRNGAFPRYLPDDDMALDCYKLASRCPDGDVAGIAQSKYVQTRQTPVPNEDRAGAPLPAQYGRRACALAKRRLSEAKGDSRASLWQRPRFPTKVEPERTFATLEPEATGVTLVARAGALLPPGPVPHDDDEADWMWLVEQLPVAATRPAPAHFMTDSQNVHDHAVTAATKRNLAALPPQTKTSPSQKAATNAEITDVLLRLGNLTDQEALDAMRVLDSLSEAKHSTLGVSEREALTRVWGRIQQEHDPQLRDNLTETLAKQLASGVEHGHVVCSTGKIARITGTLQGADLNDMETARPTWAVKDELATLAAKVRDDVLGGLDASAAAAYERGEPNSAAEERMKSEFRRRASETYVRELGMSAAVLEPMVAAMEAAF